MCWFDWFNEDYKAENNSVSPFYIIGHRGSPRRCIENTITSFDQAMKEGCNAIEIDISFTKDKHLLLFHDFDPTDSIARIRQLGLESGMKYKPYLLTDKPKPIPELTLEEVRREHTYSIRKKDLPILMDIPTLEEFFQWAQSKALKLIILDWKVTEAYQDLLPDMIKELRRLVLEYKPKFEIVIMSPRQEIIRLTQGLAPEFSTTCDMELPLGIILDTEEYSAVKKALQLNFNFASVGRAVVAQIRPWGTYKEIIELDTRLIREYKLPIKLIAWTIKDKREMDCLIRLGVNGIVVDNIPRLKRLSFKYKK